MKKIFPLLLFIMIVSIDARAATRSDVVVLESTDRIQYRAQEAAQNYLLYYLYPQKPSYQERADQNIRQLNDDIKIIETNTKNQKTKGILSFFATQGVEVLSILDMKPDQDATETLLETSEIFAEGARSIAKQHSYSFSDEEKMFSLTREMRVLLGEIVKYYTALKINPRDKSYFLKFQKAQLRFEHHWSIVKRYQYSEAKERKEKEILERAWGMMQYYLGKKNPIVPALLTMVSEDMGSQLERLGTYHSRNQ